MYGFVQFVIHPLWFESSFTDRFSQRLSHLLTSFTKYVMVCLTVVLPNIVIKDSSCCNHSLYQTSDFLFLNFLLFIWYKHLIWSAIFCWFIIFQLSFHRQQEKYLHKQSTFFFLFLYLKSYRQMLNKFLIHYEITANN